MVQLKQIAICCSSWTFSQKEAIYITAFTVIVSSRSDPSESSDGSREFLFVSLKAKFYFSAWSCSEFDLSLFLVELLYLLNKVRCRDVNLDSVTNSLSDYGKQLVKYIYGPTRYTMCSQRTSSNQYLGCSSTCFGPHRSIIRSVLYKLYSQTMVCGIAHSTRHVQLDVSSSTRITTYQSLRIQLVQNAPDDGPMRSETCRATT